MATSNYTQITVRPDDRERFNHLCELDNRGVLLEFTQLMDDEFWRRGLDWPPKSDVVNTDP